MNIQQLFYLTLVLTLFLGSALFVLGEEPHQQVVQQTPQYIVDEVATEQDSGRRTVRLTENADFDDIYSLYENQLKENNKLRHELDDLEDEVKKLKKKNGVIPGIISPGY